MTFDESYVGRLRQKVGNMKLFLNGSSVFIENSEGRILFHKGYNDDLWQLIGGLAEDNECMWETAKREVKEEVGLGVRNLQFIAMVDKKRKERVLPNGHVFTTIDYCYHTKDYSGDLVLDRSEIREIRWFDINDKELLLNVRENIGYAIIGFRKFRETGMSQYVTGDSVYFSAVSGKLGVLLFSYVLIF